MKRIAIFVSVLLLSLSSLFVLATPQASAATITWDGGGSDNNMTTAANWNPNGAPSAGDDLVFPANITDRTVENDFSAATSFNSITFSGTATQDSGYSITGNSMTLVAGINNSMTGSLSAHSVSIPLILNGTQTFQSAGGTMAFTETLNVGSSALTLTPNASAFFSVDSVISGSGSITKTGTGTLVLAGNSSSYSGAITASAGRIMVQHNNALGATSGATTISGGADLEIGNCSDMTVGENITLTGDSSNTSTPVAKLTTGAGCSGGGTDETYGTPARSGDITLSGNIALGSNITLAPVAATTTLTGGLSGDFAISLFTGYGGKLVVGGSSNTTKTANGTYNSGAKDVTLSDSLPSNTVGVFGNTVLILTGTRSDISIGASATLKGTGTAGSVSIAAGGTIAPGLSPGCLTVSGLSLAGAFDAEIGGATACSQYDQVKVTGAVTMGGTLNVSLVNSFKPVTGQKYVLISNDGTDPVTGTFTGLAQGATITVGSTAFSISYTGGDGNDVELTVTAGAPVTGFSLAQNNPLIAAGIMTLAGLGIILIARRSKLAYRRR